MDKHEVVSYMRLDNFTLHQMVLFLSLEKNGMVFVTNAQGASGHQADDQKGVKI